MTQEILIIDDEKDICNLIAGILQDEGYETRTATTIATAEEAMKSRAPALIILDVWLNDSEMDGLRLLEKFKKSHPHIPVIIISGHGTVEMAVTATKIGAVDMLEKPFQTDHLLHVIARSLKEARLIRENAHLKQYIGEEESPVLIANSAAAIQLADKVEKLSASDARLYIWGEKGVGKEMISRLLYLRSRRNNGPFIAIQCDVKEAHIFDKLLYGVEENGNIAKLGALEQAHNGVLLLDEVDKIPVDAQRNLAKILHMQKFRRLNGDTDIEVNARLISISQLSPDAALKDNKLKKDLYDRLNVMELRVPSLADRYEDFEDLYNYFIRLRALALRCPIPKTSKAALDCLKNHPWRGNISELKNIVDALMLHHQIGADIDVDDVMACLHSKHDSDRMDAKDKSEFSTIMNGDLREARQAFEKEYLQYHLKNFSGNVSKTAEFIGMDRAALHRKLKSLDLL